MRPKKRKPVRFVDKHIRDLDKKRDQKLLEIARKVDPGDEVAIDLYAQEMATDICRAGLRDIAANIERKARERDEVVDASRLAEDVLPNLEFFREAVRDLKERIREAMRAIGKMA